MKGIIYCIVDNTNYKYYIGSTNLSVGERLREHKKNYKVWVGGKTNYTSSFEIIQNNNYKIYLIKELEYDDDEKDQLLWLERNFIEDGLREGNCVNKYLPIRTEEEKIEYHKEYRIENREELKGYKKEYYIDNLKQIKERYKQYYIENKDKLIEYQKQYRIENKDKVNKKFICPCGGKYTLSHKVRHEKTITHQKYITTI
jgi:hypothetical protein